MQFDPSLADAVSNLNRSQTGVGLDAARGRAIDDATLDAVAAREGLTPQQARIWRDGILAQESGKGANQATSVNGARGAGQIIPDTFRRFARAGESIDNPADNLAVSARIVKRLGEMTGDDPARIATGYFSGEGNINPDRSGQAWRNDAADGNGKRVSSYVSDIGNRLGLEQAARPGLPDLNRAPKWADVEAKAEFKALPPAERAKAKEAYFDYWIAPHAGAQAQSLRAQFLAPGQAATSERRPAAEGLGQSDPVFADMAATGAQPYVAPTSVMDGVIPGPTPGVTESRAPVSRERRDAIERAYNAATPAQRQQMAARGDYVGQIVNELNQRYALVDERGSRTVANMDPRAERRRERMVRDGLDPQTAANMAPTQAAFDTTPGQEIPGTITPSEFNFDLAKSFRETPGLNNPLTRGLAKGGVLLAKGYAGLGEAMADAAFGAPASGRRASNALRRAEEAIGEQGDFLSRNLEGAIASIASQLPTLIAGVATGGTAIPLAGMAVNSFGNEYTDGKARGLDPARAAARAGLFAVFEVIGERFGLQGVISTLKKASQGMADPSEIAKFFANNLKKEIPGELLTTTGQFATDKLPGIGLNPEAGFAEYLRQVGDTIAQTIMQGGIMAGGTTGVARAAQFMRDGGVTPEGAFVGELDSAVRGSQWNQQAIDAEARDLLSPNSALYGNNVDPRATSTTPDGRIEPALDLNALTPPTEPVSSVMPPAPAPATAPQLDPMYEQAVAIVQQTGNPSSSVVQRHLRIGFNRAAKLIEQMEAAGLVSPLAEDGTRQLLAKPPAPAAAPTTQTADEIVRQMATEAGVPLETVLPVGTEPGRDDDRDVLDFAENRYNELLDARDGREVTIATEQGVTIERQGAKPLNPVEQAELDMLEGQRGDVAAVRDFYGFTTPPLDEADAERQAIQSEGQLPVVEQTDDDIPFGPGAPAGSAEDPFGDQAPQAQQAAQEGSAQPPTGVGGGADAPAPGAGGAPAQAGVGGAPAEVAAPAVRPPGDQPAGDARNGQGDAQRPGRGVGGAPGDAVAGGRADQPVPPAGSEQAPALSSKVLERIPMPDGMEARVFETDKGYGAGLFDTESGNYVDGSITRFDNTKDEQLDEVLFGRVEDAPARLRAKQKAAEIAAAGTPKGERAPAEEAAPAGAPPAPPKTEREARERREKRPPRAPATEKEAKQQQAEPATPPNTIFTEDAANAARERLRKKLGRLNSGIDPETMLDGITLAGYHIERGARRFAAYAKAMVDDLGDAVKPYLVSWYLAVRNDPRAAGFKADMDRAGDVEDADLDAVLAQPDKPAEPAPDAKPKIDTPEGRVQLAKDVADHLIGGNSFANINEARRFLEQRIGSQIPPGTQRAKYADEVVEAGVVLAARDIVQAARKQGRSDDVIYKRLLGLYEAQPNLAVRDSTSLSNQAYSTPIPLAFAASRLAGVTTNTRVLEATAGNGALLVEATPGNAVVNELNPDRVAMLQAQGFSPTTGDAMAADFPAKSVDRVVINPPFGKVNEKTWTVDGLETREIDHAISMKSLAALKDDGAAVLIIGGPMALDDDSRQTTYRGAAKRAFFKALYDAYNVVDHFTVAGDLYAKQGTKFPVDVIVIKGRGKSARALPAANLPTVIKTWDQLQEKMNARVDSVGPGGTGGAGGGDRGQGPATQPGSVPPAAAQTPAVASGGGRRDGPAGGVGSAAGSGADGRAAGEGDGSQANNGERGGDGASGQPGNTGQGDAASADVEQPGGGGGVRGSQPGAVDAPARERADRQVVDTEKLQVSYANFSKNKSVNTLVATNHLTPIENAFTALRARVGDIDEYVRTKLQYTPEQFSKAFSAEQVEALALAIDNVERGAGFIIGDQTGIGKGRVVAGMIRYAIRNGKMPVFVTQMPDLYGDMMRDLTDIGMAGIEPLMTNNNAAVPLDSVALDWFAEKQAIQSQIKEVEDEINAIVAAQLAPRMVGKTDKERAAMIKEAARSSKDPEVQAMREQIKELRAEIPERRGKFLETPSKDAHEAALAKMIEENSIGKHQVIFTTYDQMNPKDSGKTRRDKSGFKISPKPEFFFRHEFLSHFVNSSTMLILDESHNAGAAGAPDDDAVKRGDIVRGFINASGSVFYSSATFAKNPDVMDAYNKTDLGRAFDSHQKLISTLSSVPVQQITSAMLVEAGQMLRRERSFEGISYDMTTVSVDKQSSEDLSLAMQLVVAFDAAKQEAIRNLQGQLDAEAAMVGDISAAGQVDSLNFTGVMHNVINTFLLGLKASQTAKTAVDAIRRGEKPVITVANTMEMFISGYAEQAGLAAGSKIDATFADILQRYLDRVRTVNINLASGQQIKHYLTDEELGADGVEAYAQAADQIAQMAVNLDLPLSPIDAIKQAIEDTGHTIGEITGRQMIVDRGNILKPRNKAEMNTAGKKNTIAKFNNGQLDALIINRSGSTGLSMHASEKFDDQRRRVMIIAQAELDINNHMQMLGRVNRTGQVTQDGVAPAGMPATYGLPRYIQLSADVPIELRPAAVLSAKMASLSANTTAGRGSAVQDTKAPDFMNKYGDRIAAEVVGDNPGLNRLLGGPIRMDDKGEPITEGAMAKVTGRIGLLPLAKQTELYDNMISEYEALIAQLEALGQNDLEAKTVPLDAETRNSVVVMQADEGTISPFTAAVVAETVNIKRLGKPYTKQQVLDQVAQALAGRKPSDVQKQTIRDVEQAIDNAIKEIRSSDRSEDDKERDIAFLTAGRVAFRDRLPAIGNRYVLKTDSGNLYGVVTGISRSARVQSPAALSAWRVKFALLDGSKSITLPLSKLLPASDKNADAPGVIVLERSDSIQLPNAETQKFEAFDLYDAFDRLQTLAQRENRVMITGNILRGLGELKGRLINYTTKSGEVKQGILMPPNFDIERERRKMSAQVRSPAEALKIVDGGAAVVDRNRGAANFTLTKSGGLYLFNVTKSGWGAKFVRQFKSEVYFASAGGQLRGVVQDRELAGKLVNAVIQPPYALQLSVDGGKDQIRYDDISAPEYGKARQTDTPAFKRWFGDSKVVDASGKPLVMYHGTTRGGFAVFDRLKTLEWRGPSMDTIGSWFSDNPSDNDGAGLYARGGGDGDTIYPVYLSIQNPKRYRTFNDFLRHMHRAAGRPFPESAPGRGSTEELRAELMAEGYDGIEFEQTANESLMQDITAMQDAVERAKQEEFSVRRAERLPYTQKRERLEQTLKSMRKELDEFGSSTEFDNQRVFIAFEPTQIKSAIGNSGAFDPTNPSILKDINDKSSEYIEAARATLAPEGVRANTLVKLRALERRMEAGRLTPAEYRLGVQEAIAAIEGRNAAQDDRRAATGRRRGADWIIARLRAAVANDELERAQVDFAEWLINQNPNVANDLGISIRESDTGDAGNYNPAARVFTLFAGRTNPTTAVHEILHHAERMMPTEVQGGVIKAWRRAVGDALRKAGAEERKLIGDIVQASFGDREAKQRVQAAFADGRLSRGQHYQLHGPSEFWAVNAARIMSDRFEARGSWVQRAKQWFREFVQRVRAAFGLSSDTPIMRALEDVMNGDGLFVSPKMLAEQEVLNVSGAAPGAIEYHDIVSDVRNRVVRAFQKDPDQIKTFSLYDRTLSTQYNKALKERDFGRVFDLVSAMQNAVSLTATRPAELAPGLLPKIDDVKTSVKTLFNAGASQDDIQRASRALFAGTLYGNTVLEGVVWSEAEFMQRFDGTEASYKLYLQARDAIDQSLDELAAAEAYAMAASKIGRTMRERILNAPNDAQALIVKDLQSYIVRLNQAIAKAENDGKVDAVKLYEDSRTEVIDTLRRSQNIFRQVRELKQAGYAPLMRFGNYKITVYSVDPKTKRKVRDDFGDPVVLYFGRYETKGEMYEARKRLQAEFVGDDSVMIEQGTHSQSAHELYNGISPESLAIFAELIGQDEAAEKYYRAALSDRSALKRRLERKGVAGYSTEIQRVLAAFMTSNARLASQRYYMRDIDRAIQRIPLAKGQVRDEAIALKNFVLDGNDRGAAISSVMFTWFLGGSVASAAVNLSQTPMVTLPYLSQFGGELKAAAAVGAAMKYVAKPSVTNPKLEDALKQASLEGIVNAQEIFHLYSMGSQSVARGLTRALGAIPGLGKAVDRHGPGARARAQAMLTLWGSAFSAAEQINRKVAFVAAWNIANDLRMSDPYGFAVRAVNETQGIYNKVNRPNFGRTATGRTLLIFRQYSLMYVELLARMMRAGPAGKRAAAFMLLTLMLFAGFEGLPFMKLVDDLIDTIGQRLGYDTNAKGWKQQQSRRLMGEFFGDLFLYGMSARLPLDFSSRLGLGSIVPGTALAKPSESERRTYSVLEIVGPTAGLARQVEEADQAVIAGNPGKAAVNMMPKALKDVITGVDWAAKGYATDAAGRRTVDLTGTEAAAKVIGFNPGPVARKTRESMPIEQDTRLQRVKETEFVTRIAKSIVDGDKAAGDKARAEIRAWNQRNPETRIVLTERQIRDRIKDLRATKDQRLLRQTPPEMRGRLVPAQELD